VSELEKSDVLDLKTTGMENVTVQISAKLNGSEVFYPDIEEEVDVVCQFDASLKYVTFKISSRKCVDSVLRQCVNNAFDHLMRTRTLCNKSAIKKNTDETRFRIKGKEIRKNDEHLSFFIFLLQLSKKKNIPPSLLGPIPPRRQSQTSIF
jgi:hypothetical protein